jgi:streptogramin lyase/Ni,Fe-hydrogenase III small subunit
MLPASWRYALTRSARSLAFVTGFAMIAASCVALMNPIMAAAASPITEYPLTNAAGPNGITLGPDGNVWVAETGLNKLASVTPAGVVTEYAADNPFRVVTGPDGALWFTDLIDSKIGRFNTSTHLVTNLFPTLTAASNPEGIALGSDGNLWFVEENVDKVAKITTAGVVTEYPGLTALSMSESIAAGPDGNLWVTEQKAAKIAKVTTAGVVTEYPITANSFPRGITAGPDGNVWFTESLSEKVGRISTTGSIAEFPVPANPNAANPHPRGITTGADGRIWFAEDDGQAVYSLGTSGTFSQAYMIPTNMSSPFDMTTGADGSVWFVEQLNDKVAKMPTGLYQAYFPWFDRISSPGFQGDNIHVVNPSAATISFVLNIPGQPACSFGSESVAAGAEKFYSCATGFGGPVTLTASGRLIATQRVQYFQSFNEVAAVPLGAAATSLYFPWYDRVSSPGFLADNIHVVNPQAAIFNVTVSIPGCADQQQTVQPGSFAIYTCATGFGGPVHVSSPQPVIATQRVQYFRTFNETAAQAGAAGATTLYSTWFDRASSPGFTGDNIHVVNPQSGTANVTVSIPGCSPQSAALMGGTQQFFTCAGGFGGPVKITADASILASQRVQYFQSFNEVPTMAAGATSLYVAWYDRISDVGFQADNIHVLNVQSTVVNVTVTVVGCPAGQAAVDPGKEYIYGCATGFGGPVHIVASSGVMASARVQYYQTFNEVAASP